MATRLYLPISGTPPLAALAVDSNWELTTSLARLPCFTAKQNTALTTTTLTWPATSTQQWCWRQWQSDVLKAAYNWTTADTVSMVIGRCAETTNSGDTHLAYVVRVVSGDGGTIRGVIGLYHATSTEYPLMASAATRIHNARTNGATNFSSQVGDRIIVEIGLHGVTPAAENIQMRFGDPSATSDFALTAGLTTDLVPWVELSRTVEFGYALTIQDSAQAQAIEAPALTQHNILVIQDSGQGQAVDNVILTQHNVLAILDMAQPQAMENVTLTAHDPATALVIQDSAQAQETEAPGLTQHNVLAIQDAAQAQAMDGVSLTQHNTLSIQDIVQAETIESLDLTQHNVLAIQDSLQGQIIDNVTLTYHPAGAVVLVIQDSVQAQVTDSLSLVFAAGPAADTSVSSIQGRQGRQRRQGRSQALTPPRDETLILLLFAMLRNKVF